MQKVTSFVSKQESNMGTEVLSGLTVALALVPEAVAFAFVAGLSPIVGLYGAFMMGIVTSLFGGRPGMISGATGAMAVVMVSLVSQGEVMGGSGAGLQYLLASLLLTGALQIAAGLFKLGKFIRMVPYPVMLGFVNGLAIVIFMAQFGHFKELGPDGIAVWMTGASLYTMLGLTGLTVALIYVFPLLTKAIPSSLASIMIVSSLVGFFGVDTKTVGDLGSIGGSLPVFSIPDVPLNWETLRIVLPYSFLLACIGLIETLLTLNLIDDMTDTVNVISNTDWSWSSDSDWLTSTEEINQNGTNAVFGFDVVANPENSARTGKITFTTDDGRSGYSSNSPEG